MTCLVAIVISLLIRKKGPPLRFQPEEMAGVDPGRPVAALCISYRVSLVKLAAAPNPSLARPIFV
jgi:hypothetical protein